MSQDDQRLFGQGFISGVVCDGRMSWYRYQVAAAEGSFHRGSAYTSAYLLAHVPGGAGTVSGGHTRFGRVR